MTNTIITLDIETIPTQSPEIIHALLSDAEVEKSALTAPSNYKDAEKIAAHIKARSAEIDASFDERYRKTALDGTYGQIVVAAIAIEDQEPFAFWSADWRDSEHIVIGNLFSTIENCYAANPSRLPVFVGHNVLDFDFRFLFQRAAILGIRPPPCIPFDSPAWSDRVFDTMTRWSGRWKYISLDNLCRAFGIPEKGELDGSKVWDAVKYGRITDVVEYCKDDVRRTREIYKRITFQEAL